MAHVCNVQFVFQLKTTDRPSFNSEQFAVLVKDESGMPVLSRYFGTLRLRLRLPVEYGNAERLRYSRLRRFKGRFGAKLTNGLFGT